MACPPRNDWCFVVHADAPSHKQLQSRSRWLLKTGTLAACEAMLRCTAQLQQGHAVPPDVQRVHRLSSATLSCLQLEVEEAAAQQAHQAIVATVRKCLRLAAAQNADNAATASAPVCLDSLDCLCMMLQQAQIGMVLGRHSSPESTAAGPASPWSLSMLQLLPVAVQLASACSMGVVASQREAACMLMCWTSWFSRTRPGWPTSQQHVEPQRCSADGLHISMVAATVWDPM